MLKLYSMSQNQILEDWHLDSEPAQITVHNLKTGKQIQEPSLAAISCGTVKSAEINLHTGETQTVTRTALDKLAAAGRAALEYKNTPGMVVFSPFRHGQIIHYPAAELLIKALLKQVCSGLPVLKPVMCVHVQERTTQVEQQAIAEAAIMVGARKVFLYTEPLAVILKSASSCKELRSAVILHIEPQD